MVTFLGVARMVDSTAVMGVLGWGGGDGNVPWRCTHGRCYVDVDVARMDGVKCYLDLPPFSGTRNNHSSCFTVPMAQIHRSSVWCNVLARAVACVRTAWTQLKVKEEKFVVRQTTCVIANMLEMMILMMMMMMMMTNDHDDDDSWPWWWWWWWWWWSWSMMMMMMMMMTM